MTDPDARWQPRRSPSALELARAARTSPSGAVRLRNDANAMWSTVFAWGLLAMAALLLNRSILTDPDPMRPVEVAQYAAAICVASVGSLVTLGRSRVVVLDGLLAVRNPLRTYRTPLETVTSVEHGLLGFPVLTAAGRRVRLVGLEETLSDRWGGGSEDVRILRQLVVEAAVEGPAAGVAAMTTSWTVPDRPVLLLLFGWAVYAVALAI